MKKLFFILITILLSSPAFSQSGSITVTSVAQRSDGSGLMDVYFNLKGPGSVYYISL